MNISINSKTYNCNSKNELPQIIELAFESDFNEIWMEGEDDIALCILINPQYSFLMYLRYKGDSGFHSLSDLSEAEESKFLLMNEQEDMLPLNWLVSRDLAKKAMIYFFEEQAMCDDVVWVEE